MIEQDLFTYVTTDTDMNSLIGNSMFPLIAPQGFSGSRVVYTKISNPEATYGGSNPTKYHKFQLDLYAPEYKYIKQGEEYLLSLFDAYSGQMGNTRVYQSSIDRVMDMYDSASEMFRLSFDVLLRTDK